MIELKLQIEKITIERNDIQYVKEQLEAERDKLVSLLNDNKMKLLDEDKVQSDLRHQVETLQSEVQEAKRLLTVALEEMTNENNSLKSQYESLSQLLQETQTNLQSLSKENSTLRAYQSTAMLAEEEARRNIAQLRESLLSQTDRTAGELDERDRELLSLRASFEDMRRQHDVAEADRIELRLKLTELQGMLNDSSLALRRALAEQEQLLAGKEQLQAECNALNEKLKQSEVEIRTLTSSLLESEKDRVDLRTQLLSIQEECTHARDNFEKLRLNQRALDSEKSSLESRLQQLEGEVADLSTRSAALVVSRDELREDLARSGSRLRGLLDTYGRLSSTVNNVSEEVSEVDAKDTDQRDTNIEFILGIGWSKLELLLQDLCRVTSELAQNKQQQDKKMTSLEDTLSNYILQIAEINKSIQIKEESNMLIESELRSSLLSVNTELEDALTEIEHLKKEYDIELRKREELEEMYYQVKSRSCELNEALVEREEEIQTLTAKLSSPFDAMTWDELGMLKNELETTHKALMEAAAASPGISIKAVQEELKQARADAAEASRKCIQLQSELNQLKSAEESGPANNNNNNNNNNNSKTATNRSSGAWRGSKNMSRSNSMNNNNNVEPSSPLNPAPLSLDKDMDFEMLLQEHIDAKVQIATLAQEAEEERSKRFELKRKLQKYAERIASLEVIVAERGELNTSQGNLPPLPANNSPNAENVEPSTANVPPTTPSKTSTSSRANNNNNNRRHSFFYSLSRKK